MSSLAPTVELGEGGAPPAEEGVAGAEMDLAEDAGLDWLGKGAAAVFGQGDHDGGQTFLDAVQRGVKVCHDDGSVRHDGRLGALHGLVRFGRGDRAFLLRLLVDLAVVGLGAGGAGSGFAFFAGAFGLKDGRADADGVAPGLATIGGADEADGGLRDGRGQEGEFVGVEGRIARLELRVDDVDDVAVRVGRIGADGDPGLVEEIGGDFAPLAAGLVDG